MKNPAKKLTLSITTGLLLALASSQAFASPRLCGHIAVDTPNKIGLLAELSDNDSMYHQKCDQAIKDSWDKIQGNAQLQALSWKQIKRNKCWDVGKNGFINQGQSADLLCDTMQDNYGYKIIKKGPEAAAVFEKQSAPNPGGAAGVANDIDNGINQGTKAIKNFF
jgi:hypothetical protein